VDEAASRFYFALFQAGVHSLERRGKRPGDVRSGAAYWEHRTVANHAALIRGVRADRGLFRRAMKLRLVADYNLNPVERRAVEFVCREVERFVLEVTA
ncbi:MAG: hypothetical protein ACREIU_10105, partial [Planctomycetota bacterium]